jgi:hypothetical protein
MGHKAMSDYIQSMGFEITVALIRDKKVNGKRSKTFPTIHLAPFTFDVRAGGES